MTQLEVIWKFMASLSDANSSDNKTMLDAAVRACSNYDGIEDALAEFLAAAKSAKDSTTFLAECGINVSNSDTGGITGSDAGGSVTKTADTTVWEIANTYTANANATAAQKIFTGDNGWHVSATAFNDTIYSSGEDSISAGAGDDLIFISSDNSVVITGGNNDTVSIGGAVNYFTVKDFTEGKTTLLGADSFDSYYSTNDDGSKDAYFYYNPYKNAHGFAGFPEGGYKRSGGSSETVEISAGDVDLSKVNTLSGNFDSSGNFTGSSTLSSGNFLGNVTSEFDPSFLDVDSSGNLSFTYRGLKLNIIGQRDPTSKNVTTAINSSNIDSFKGDWRYVIIAGLYKWWLKESLDLNAEAIGLGFTDGTATVAEMDLYFENYTSQSWLAYVSSSYDTDNGKTVKLSLVINQRYFGSVSNENDPNCNVSGGTLDRTIAHEFNHGIFAANVNYFAYLPIFIKEGMAELIHGVDDKRLTSMSAILRNTVNDNSNSWLEDYVRLDILNSSQVSTLKGGSSGAAYPYAAGYMFLRWLAKNSSDDAEILADEKLSARVELRTDGVYYISGTRHLEETAQIVSFNGEYTGVSVGTVSGSTYTLNSAIKQIVTYFNTKSAWNISGVGDNVTIMADDSAKGNDTISGGGTGILIQSGAGNDSISVADFSDGTIYGGDGADTIRIGSSVSSLTFADFDAADVLDLASSVSSASFNSSTKTLTLGSATIILPNVGSSLYFFRKVAVQNGGAKTTLGDLLGDDGYTGWAINGTTAVYGAAAFTLSVTSFASGVTAETLENILQVTNSGGTYSVSFASGKNVTDLIGAGTATLNGATWNVTSSPSSTIAAGFTISGTTATYKTAEVIAGYSVSSDAKKITYTAASGGESLVTVTGVKNISGLSLSGKVVTISASSLNAGTVTISDGYTLRLGSDVTISTAAEAGWNLSGTTATYNQAATIAGYVLSSDGKNVTYNSGSGGGTLVTVTGVKNISGLSLSDKVVTVAAAALNQTAVTVSSGYTLNLAADVAISETTAAGWNLSGTTAAYKTAAVSAGYVLKNNAVSYNSASGGETLVTVSGVKNISGLSLSGKVVTISDAALNQGTVTISDGYTLKLGSDVAVPEATAAGWNISGTTASYGAAGTTAGYVLSSDGKTVTYTPAGRETLITLTGLKSGATASGLSISGAVVTLSASVLGEDTVYISGNYTLALNKNVTTPVTTAGGWSVSGTSATYTKASTTAGYYVMGDGKSVRYAGASGGESLVTVSGLREGVSAGEISMLNRVVTLKASMLDGGTVTVTDGYTLKFASSVTQSATTAAHWEVANGTAKYIDEAISAGYVLSDDARTASYQAASGGETLVEISGLKTTATVNSISLSGTEITLKASALNQGTVTISGGYTLKLASNVTLSETTAAHWELASGTAKYIGEKISAGYVLENNAVSYNSASGGATLVTVTGVKNLSGITLADKTVTISAAALNQSAVTVSSGYTLKLASDVTLSETTAAHWELANGVAKYVSEKISAGYVLENNAVSYNSASGGETLVSVTGVKSLDGISLENKTVTISATALNQSAVTISSGYTLKLAADVELSETTAAHWEIANGAAKYLSEKISAGYVLENNAVSYNTASGGETEITVTGVKNIDGLSLSGKTVTVSTSALNQSAVTISSGYTLKLAADVTLSETTAAHWELANGVAKYVSEKISAGYVLENNAVSYNTASGGETEITVTGVKNIDGLSLSDKTVTVSASALNQSAVTVSSGYELALAADVNLSETTAAHWELANGTAKYVSEKISAGYILANNAVSYKSATGGATLVTVTGVKNLSGITLADKTVTISAAALNQSAVTISDGYTLKLASDVTLSETTAAHWELADGAAKYLSEKISAGYVLENNSVSYNATSGGDTLVTVTGVKSLDGITLAEKTVTVSASSLNQSTVTVSRGYTLALA